MCFTAGVVASNLVSFVMSGQTFIYVLEFSYSVFPPTVPTSVTFNIIAFPRYYAGCSARLLRWESALSAQMTPRGDSFFAQGGFQIPFVPSTSRRPCIQTSAIEPASTLCNHLDHILHHIAKLRHFMQNSSLKTPTSQMELRASFRFRKRNFLGL